MKKLLNATLFAAGLSAGFSAAAENVNCYVQVAVSNSYSNFQNVAFNVSNAQIGLNRSLTISGKGSPQIIPDLPCTSSAYTVSATGYTPQQMAQTIGVCILKAGAVVLANPGDNMSVVFPEDFECS